MNPEMIEKISAIIDDPEKTEAVLQILEDAYQRKRTERKQCQADGIRAAKERGVQFGRPCLKVPKNFPAIYEQYRNKTMTITAASQALKISRASFHRVVDRYLESIGEQPEPKTTKKALPAETRQQDDLS